MGGMLVTLLAVTSPPQVVGIVLSGPALPTSASLGFATRFITATARVAPWLPMRKLAASAISRDPAVVEAYENDPLVYRGRMRAGTIGAFVRAAQRIEQNTELFTQPLLIVHGSEDALAAPGGSEQLIARAASTDKELKVYPGLFHEVFQRTRASGRAGRRDRLAGSTTQCGRRRIG